jgi:hypothetical protein
VAESPGCLLSKEATAIMRSAEAFQFSFMMSLSVIASQFFADLDGSASVKANPIAAYLHKSIWITRVVDIPKWTVVACCVNCQRVANFDNDDTPPPSSPAGCFTQGDYLTPEVS